MEMKGIKAAWSLKQKLQDEVKFHLCEYLHKLLSRLALLLLTS